MDDRKSLLFVFLTTLVAVAITFGFAAAFRRFFPGTPELAMGAVLVLTIAMLMTLLYIMAAGYSKFNLADRQQALGLPQGSVRAMIALFLIMVFVIFGIYLFRAINSPSTTKLTGLTAAQVAELPAQKIVAVEPSMKTFDVVIRTGEDMTTTTTLPGLTAAQVADFPAQNIVKVEPSGSEIKTFDVVVRTGEGMTTTTTLPGLTVAQVAEIPEKDRVSVSDGEPIETSDVTIRVDAPEEGVRLAQQLLTTVGTLVVAVAGFYFGTRSVVAARGAVLSLEPVIRSIKPDESQQGEEKDVTILGKNFQSPKTVKLVSGSDEMTCESVTSSATKIRCKLKIGKEASVGKWELVVVNQDGGEDRLSEAFTVVAAPKVSPPPVPVVTGIDPPSSEVKDGVSVKIAGTGFVEGARVKLVRAGQPDIEATELKVVSDKEITCTFDLTGKTPGKWDVVVINPDQQQGKKDALFEVK